jgi:hypothetical protein
MKYALLTPTGRIYTFHIQALATSYQQAYGGQLIPLQAEGLSENACSKFGIQA